jgi:NAD(P)-dependent dehydrogenase (short-subunit alcohol dehydrogenase family)
MTNRTKLAIAMSGIAAGMVARKALHRSREQPVAGEVVLITGGSRGLGLALARQFGREGCRVAICARDEDELARAREYLLRRGTETMTVRCDVTKRSDVEQMMDEVTAHYGHINILVNNAGIIHVGPIESMTIEDFEDAMNVMFWGTVYPTLALLPRFLARDSGRVVNITSIGGKVSVPHLLPYTSAKNAAVGFSEGLRTELSRTGIRVTTIAPGLMRTGSFNAALFKGNQAAESRWFSLGASLPGFSMNAHRAARQIVSAVKGAEAEKVLSVPASLLATAHALAPGFTQDLIGLVGSLVLPQANGNKRAKAGWGLPNLRSPGMRTMLFLGRLAARRLNQKTA